MHNSKPGGLLLAPAFAALMGAAPQPAQAAYVKKPVLPRVQEPGLLEEGLRQEPEAKAFERDLTRILVHFHEKTGREVISCVQKCDRRRFNSLMNSLLRKTYGNWRFDAINTKIAALSLSGQSYTMEQRGRIAIGIGMSLLGPLRQMSRVPGGEDFVRQVFGGLANSAPGTRGFIGPMEEWVLSKDKPEVLFSKLINPASEPGT